MAYNTRGLSVANGGLSGQHYQQWVLDSDDDWGNAGTADSILSTGYITDAADRGMQVGDPVFVRRWDSYTDPYTRGDLESGNTACDWAFVSAISTTGTNVGAATLVRL